MKYFLISIENLTETNRYKASIGEGPDQISAEASNEEDAMGLLLLEMNNYIANNQSIPTGWVGGRPNDR
jgi:hypothetical protein